MSDLHARVLVELDRLDRHRLTTLGKVVDAVLKLHKPVTFWRPWSGEPAACERCSMLLQAAGTSDPAPYPCLTITETARELGVEP